LNKQFDFRLRFGNQENRRCYLKLNILRVVIAGQVVTALKRGEAHEILLLESEKDIKGRKETLLLPLCFLLVVRVKVIFSASSTSTAISTSGKILE